MLCVLVLCHNVFVSNPISLHFLHKRCLSGLKGFFWEFQPACFKFIKCSDQILAIWSVIDAYWLIIGYLCIVTSSSFLFRPSSARPLTPDKSYYSSSTILIYHNISNRRSYFDRFRLLLLFLLLCHYTM